MNVRSIRYRLKRETDIQHSAVERLASTLDLTVAEEFCLFLAAHQHAYACLISSGNYYAKLLGQRQACIEQDLQILGYNGPALALPLIAKPQTCLGYLYVLAGAHLGAKVLAKQWERSRDPRVLRAKHFMTDSSLADPWKTFNAQASIIPVEGQDADRIIQSANDCFGLFQNAFAHVLSHKEDVYAS